MDPLFCTLWGQKAAELLAYEKLGKHIVQRIHELENPDLITQVDSPETNLRWTDSKVALVELIYGLYSAGSINGGRIEIAEISKALEKLFNIQVGDLYRRYLEIKFRKSSTTKFLDHLVGSLRTKIEEDLD